MWHPPPRGLSNMAKAEAIVKGPNALLSPVRHPDRSPALTLDLPHRGPWSRISRLNYKKPRNFYRSGSIQSSSKIWADGAAAAAAAAAGTPGCSSMSTSPPPAPSPTSANIAWSSPAPSWTTSARSDSSVASARSKSLPHDPTISAPRCSVVDSGGSVQKAIFPATSGVIKSSNNHT